MNWYYEDRGREAGPIGDEELQRLFSEGRIRRNTLVWREGMQDWQAYEQVAPAAPPSELVIKPPAPVSLPPDQAICNECGRTFSVDDLIQHGSRRICAECKPLFVQRLREGVRHPSDLEYVGFWPRFAAKLLDGLILYAVNMVLSLILIVPMSILAESRGDSAAAIYFASVWAILLAVRLGLSLTYATLFVGKYAATPGKMALGIKVVNADGTALSYGRACGRYFAQILSDLTLYVGYIIAAFDEEHRALHDRILNTRVVKK